MNKYEAIKYEPDSWGVEFIRADGSIEKTLFMGSWAEDRAKAYADWKNSQL